MSHCEPVPYRTAVLEPNDLAFIGDPTKLEHAVQLQFCYPVFVTGEEINVHLSVDLGLLDEMKQNLPGVRQAFDWPL